MHVSGWSDFRTPILLYFSVWFGPEVGIVPSNSAPATVLRFSAALISLSFLQKVARRAEARGGKAGFPRGNVPRSLAYRRGSAFNLRDNFKSRLRAKSAGGPEHESQSRDRSDSNDTIWFVALAKEQFAAITDDWFHNGSFS